MAIGACVLNSLVCPISYDPNDDSNSAIVGSTDARFSVMGIISFILYFNWLSWVFAWLDTGRRCHVVHSILYLAPYLRKILSLSLEESWLPIVSIVFCIIHIQLEASMWNGDLQDFQLFNKSLKYVSPLTKMKNANLEGDRGISKKGRKIEHANVSSLQDETRNEVRERGLPGRPLDQPGADLESLSWGDQL